MFRLIVTAWLYFEMKVNVFSTLFCFIFLISVTHAIVCLPNFCDSVKCKEPICDGENMVVKKGGICKCCNTCIQILGNAKTK